jgi:Transglycosylase SLT domain
MAVKSIIDIDVDDSSFKQFYALFEKYRKAVETAPKSWEKADKAIGGAADTTKDLTAAIAAQTNILTKHVDAYAKMRDNIRSADTAMVGLNRTAKKTFDLITSTTQSLFKWGSLFLGGATALAGFGGFFGFESLARSQGATRTSAMGLGITPSEYQAANIAYERLGGAGDLLNRLALAPGNVGEQAKLSAYFGVSPGNQNAAQLLPMVLQSMQKQLQQPGWASNWQLIGSKMFGDYASPTMLRMLHDMSPEELNKLVQEAQKPTGATSKAQERYQDFTMTLERARTEIENNLAGPLSKLAEPLGNVITSFGILSKTLFEDSAFQDGIKNFSQWLIDLSNELKTPEFRDSIRNFMHSVGEVITGLARLAAWLASWFGSDKKIDDETTVPPTPGDTPPAIDLWGLDPKTGKFRKLEGIKKGAYTPGAEGKFSAIEASYGLQPGMLQAVENIESSGGKGRMLSEAGAKGYFQFMPGTARQYGLRDPWNEMEAAGAAGRYLRDLYNEFQDTDKALAAYNWGPGNVRESVRKANLLHTYWKNYLPQETLTYIQKFHSQFGSTTPVSVGRGDMISLNITNTTGGVLTASSNNLAVPYAYGLSYG